MSKFETTADKLKRIQDNEALAALQQQMSAVPEADDSALRAATAQAQKAMRTPFQYNYANDPSYKALYQAAVANGQKAMKDTMGKLSAFTGGYANSYMQTAGQGAYNEYMTRLNEQIPTLENAAYQRYRQGIDDEIKNIELEKLLYGNDVDRRNAKLSSLQNQYNNLYKMVGDDTDAYNKALAGDIELANIPYQNQQNLDYQTKLDNMRTQNAIAENKAKNADDLAYQKSLADYKNSINIDNGNNGSPNGSYKYEKGTAAYNTAIKTAKDEISNGHYSTAGNTIWNYIESGAIEPETAIDEYKNGLVDAVTSGKITSEKAAEVFEDWADKHFPEEWYEYGMSVLNEIKGAQPANDKGKPLTRFDTNDDQLALIWKKARNEGRYNKSFNDFMHEFTNKRITVYSNGVIE